MNIKCITKGEYENIITDDIDYIRFGSDDAIYHMIGESYEPVFNEYTLGEIKKAREIYRFRSQTPLFNPIENKIISYGWKFDHDEDESTNHRLVYRHPNLPPIIIVNRENDSNIVVIVDHNDYPTFSISSAAHNARSFYYQVVGYIVEELIKK